MGDKRTFSAARVLDNKHIKNLKKYCKTCDLRLSYRLLKRKKFWPRNNIGVALVKTALVVTFYIGRLPVLCI